MSMTMEAFLAALEAARHPPDAGEGFTAQEIHAATGVGRDRVQALLREAQARGMLRVTQRRYRRVDGVWTKIPAYIIEGAP